jgi:integrase
MAARSVTGHAFLADRKRGPQWYVKYRLPSGRQVQRKLGPAWTERGRPPAGYFTKKTAEQALQEILVDARRGTLADMDRPAERTFADACSEWLRYVEHDKQRAASTIRDYRNVVDHYLLEEFGAETPLTAITRDRIDQYRDDLMGGENPLSRRTIQKVLVLLHGILKRAKRKGWIDANPAEDVERVTVSRTGEFNVLSVEQVEAVARACREPLYSALIVVASYTGLRLGELRALRWSHVDFTNRNILVQRNLPSHGIERAPKSGKVRSVPLIDDAARALDQLSRRELFTASDDRVFTRDGDALDDNEIRTRVYAAMEAAGIDRETFPAGPFRLHDLRHTFGTIAAQRWQIQEVQAYMGHADLKTTMVYVHHVPKVAAAAELSAHVAALKGGVATGGGNADEALRELASLLRRYEHVAELADVWTAIETAMDRVPKDVPN